MLTTNPKTKLNASQSESRSKQKEIRSRNMMRTDEQRILERMQLSSLLISPSYILLHAKQFQILKIISIRLIQQPGSFLDFYSSCNSNLLLFSFIIKMNKLIKQLPFSNSFPSKLKPVLPLKWLILNLGTTFYPRLVQIHQNIVQSIAQNDQKYLKSAMIPQLSTQFQQLRAYYKRMGYRFKINDPTKPLLAKKNLVFTDKVYKTTNFYITVVPKVYFGAKLDHNRGIIWANNQKVIRFGSRRFFVYDTNLSIAQNIKNILNQQIYEFVVKYETNLYIKLIDNNEQYTPQSSKSRFDEDDKEDLVCTQVVLRSSNQKFDWIIVDINKMLSNKS